MKQKDSSAGLIIGIFSAATIILALGVVFITMLSFRMQEEEKEYYSRFDFSEEGILFSLQQDVSVPDTVVARKNYLPVQENVTAKSTTTNYCLCVYGDGTLTLNVIVFPARQRVLGDPPSLTKQLNDTDMQRLKQAIREAQLRKQLKNNNYTYYGDWDETESPTPACLFWDGEEVLSFSSSRVRESETLSDLSKLLHDLVTEEEWNRFENDRQQYLRFDTEYSWNYKN